MLTGFLLLPALIYFVGTRLLGNYGGGPHLGSFFGDLYRDLGDGSLAAWSIVLGPAMLLQALRWTLIPWPRFKSPPADAQTPDSSVDSSVAHSAAPPQRREPFIGA